MAYLLASLNILVHWTVHGDGIYLSNNPLSTVRYCKFLRLFLLALRSVVPPPAPCLPYLPSRTSPQLDFNKHVVLQMGGARRFDRHSHRDPHTLTYTSTNQTSLRTHRTHAVMWVQNEKQGIKLAKMDWANFYIYVPVYISTTLWPWVVFSSAVLHYPHFPHKGKKLQLHLLTWTMYHKMFSLCVFFLALCQMSFNLSANVRGVGIFF